METQTVDENGYYEFTSTVHNEAERLVNFLVGLMNPPNLRVDYVDGKDYQGSLGGQVGDDVIRNLRRLRSAWRSL